MTLRAGVRSLALSPQIRISGVEITQNHASPSGRVWNSNNARDFLALEPRDLLLFNNWPISYESSRGNEAKSAIMGVESQHLALDVGI